MRAPWEKPATLVSFYKSAVMRARERKRARGRGGEREELQLSMAISPFLPSTPSSSYRETQSNKLALNRSCNGTIAKAPNQNDHQLQKPHHNKKSNAKKKKKKKKPPSLPAKPPSSWEQLKSIFTCRIAAHNQVHDPRKAKNTSNSKYSKLGSSCSSICTFKDVVHNSNPPIHHRHGYPDTLSVASGALGSEANLLAPANTSSSSSKGVLQLRKLSGCYECRAITEPRSRYPTPRTIASCPECGDVFTKAESLEVHQIIRHAVSELGPEDSGRNIVEIIFKSSWLKKDQPFCKIERILKVHNTNKTVARFEDYRDAIKQEKKNARCAADGNELLRFHCSNIVCNLGARGGTSLCSSSSLSSSAPCGVCTVIRHGFGKARCEPGKGVRTTASSGRAHDSCPNSNMGSGIERRAMLVCRVIAGRIGRVGDDDSCSSSSSAFDSTANGGAEELFVSAPKAILPCFVVIYRVISA